MNNATLPALDKLPVRHPESDEIIAVIETPKGCRTKLKFDDELRAMIVSKVLPAGAVFPFDFGFIPHTRADDGDPEDVLVLMDEPVPAGCAVEVRLIGVIEAEQMEDDEKPERNDRLIAVAVHSNEYDGVKSLDDLPEPEVKEIEHFFVSYHQLQGAKFKVLGRRNGKHARKLLEKAMRAAKRK